MDAVRTYRRAGDALLYGGMRNTKVIWGDVQSIEAKVFNVTSLTTDLGLSLVIIQYQDGVVVNNFMMSMEEAQHIGFLDFSKLEGIFDKL